MTKDSLFSKCKNENENALLGKFRSPLFEKNPQKMINNNLCLQLVITLLQKF